MSALSSPSFGSLLRHHRLAAGPTQEELAERAGLSPRAIFALERGERHRPYRQTLGLLASALQLSPLETESLRRAAGYATTPALPATGTVPTIPPLVGRSRELAAVERFLAGHHPPVLIFAGEPGIGKSRLLREAARSAQAGGSMVLRGGGRGEAARNLTSPCWTPYRTRSPGSRPRGFGPSSPGAAG